MKLLVSTLNGPLWMLMVVTILSSCCSTGTSKSSRPCGPSKQCNCTSLTNLNITTQLIKMTCSGKHVHLNDICNIIKHDKKIVWLDVNNITVTKTLGKAELIGCNEVRRLQMIHCGISNISDDAFTVMTNLTELDLSENNLESVYTGRTPTFLKPVNKLLKLSLRLLNIHYENMTLKYPDVYLSNASQVESLNLDGLPDPHFPIQYQNMTKLKTLILSGSKRLFCRIDKLTDTSFENVRYVENLYISQCMITTVEAETFRALPNLRRLDISLNRQLGFEPINNISYGLQFTNIEFLNYSYNVNTFGLGQILTKEDICYLSNTSLTEIALDGVRLELVETNALLLVPRTLETLHLNDNRFTFGLYLLQLACLDNLKTADVSLQNLAHNPKIYVKEKHDRIESRCREWNELSNCPYLDEQYLLNISRNIQNCQYFNETPTSMKTGAPLPSKIKNLTCSNCNLNYRVSRIPLFPLNNEIENVDVSGNIFQNLEGPVGPAKAIKFVNISRNYCSCIGPNFFLFMVNLEVLDMQKNILGQLLEMAPSAEIFKPLAKLRSVNFSHNLIKNLAPNIFSYMVNLERLDLSYNSIDTWTLDTSNLRNLTHLDLKFNSIGTLPETITNQLTNMFNLQRKNFTIDLTNNPIRYECVHRKFLKWMAMYESCFVNMNEYVFIDDNGNVITAAEFKEEVKHIDAQCQSYTIPIVLSSVGIAIFLTFIASGIIYKNRWKLRYFLYMNKTRFSGYRSYEPLGNYKYDAFISYSDENSDFRDDIMRNLEDAGNIGMITKLCIHERDFRPGRAIAENIADAIQTSKKTIIVLSKAYLKSKWCLHEFHMARMESIYSRSGESIIIVVMLEEVPLDNNMPLELMQWIRQDSYLEYTEDEMGQVIFWDKLRESILG